MSSPIASLFAELGFRVNENGIKHFEKQLKGTAEAIQKNSAATVKANNAADKSTGKTQRKQDKFLQHIRANYAKVLPSLEKAYNDLSRIQDRLSNTELSSSKRDAYQAAQARVEKRINHLVAQEKKAREQIAKAEDRERAKQQRQKDAEDKKWQDIREKRDLELHRKRTQQYNEEQAEKKKAQRERVAEARKARTQARQDASDRRADERLSLQRQRQKHNEAHKERAAQRAERRLQLAEERRLQSYRRGSRRSGKGYYRGAREYGRAFIPGIGGAFAAMQSTQSYQNYVGMQSGLTMATGSSDQANQEIEWLSGLANKLGMFVGEMGKNYTSLAANTKNTSLEGQGTRDIFEAVSSYSRVLNLSKEDQSGVFRALSQMVGKGQIYAEELRQQMGERAPGALQAMSRAAGFGDSEEAIAKFYKAVEAGEIKATTVFPKFSEELMKMANSGGALEKAINNTGAAIGRFKTNVWLANKTFNESGYDKAVRDFFNTTSDAIQRAEPLWEALGKASEYVGLALEAPIELFGILASKLPVVTEFVKENSTEFKLLAAALVILLRPLRKLVMLTMVLPLGLMAISDLIQNWNRDRSWQEWAVQIGLAVAAVTMLVGALGKLLRVGKAVNSVFGGGSATAGAGAAGGGVLSTLGKVAKVGGVGTYAALKSEKLGGGLDYVDSSSGRPSFTDKLDSEQRVYGLLNDKNFPAYNKYQPEGTTINGDLNITVNSPDSNLAGKAVREEFENQLRTASGSEQVTEK